MIQLKSHSFPRLIHQNHKNLPDAQNVFFFAHTRVWNERKCMQEGFEMNHVNHSKKYVCVCERPRPSHV